MVQVNQEGEKREKTERSRVSVGKQMKGTYRASGRRCTVLYPARCEVGYSRLDVVGSLLWILRQPVGHAGEEERERR